MSTVEKVLGKAAPKFSGTAFYTVNWTKLDYSAVG
jgi:hypothetical protein